MIILRMGVFLAMWLYYHWHRNYYLIKNIEVLFDLASNRYKAIVTRSVTTPTGIIFNGYL